MKIFHKTLSEPIGSAAPKFSQETKNLGFVRPLGVTLSLLCAAQGFPIPAYRLVRQSNDLYKRVETEKLFHDTESPWSSIQAFNDKHRTKSFDKQYDFQNQLAVQLLSFLKKQKA